MKGKTLEGACSTHAVLPWARNRHAGLEISYKHIYQCAHASYKAARMQHAYYLGPETDTQDKTILTGKSFKARTHATRQHSTHAACILPWTRTAARMLHTRQHARNLTPETGTQDY